MMAGVLALVAGPAQAQRAGENILTAAKDAFGTQLGRDNFGLYTQQSVRGFSPTQAGNNRILGLYFDQLGGVTRGIRLGGSVKVGLATLDTPFPAPTGVVDTILRVPSENDLGSTTIGLQRTYKANFEFEKEVNLSRQAAFTVGGLAEYRNIFNGDQGHLHGIGITGRLRPADGVELIPFLGTFTRFREFSPPRWFTRDRLRPPSRVDRFRIIGPSWATDGETATNGGLVTRLRPDENWDVDIGLFRAVQIRQDSHSTLVRDIDAEGIGNRIVISDPRQLRTSWSGEARVSRRFSTGDFAHTVIGSVRGRRVDARIGGAARVDLGRFGLNERVEVPRPVFNYGPLTSDKVSQTIYGLGYQGRWGGVAEVAGGVQYNDYLKRIDQPGQPLVRLPDKVMQFNGTAAVNLSSRLALYGAFTQGLEETPNPPPEAVNRNDLLPAQRTEQMEAGLRIKLPANLTLNTAAFSIEKPLFALDDDLFFRPRGTLRHRGVEASLAGAPVKGLTVLAGGLFLDAANAGEEVGAGGLGRRAVARSRVSGRLALDWRLDHGSSPWSFDLVMEGNGPAEATRDNFGRGPSALDIDIGMRYRFNLGQNAAMFRVQLVNVSNVYRWQVAGDAAWNFNEPRSVVAFLTVDI
jgi:iron complex outermembrane receptor protein